MARARTILGALAVLLLTHAVNAAWEPSARAEAFDQRAVERAHQFLAGEKRGRTVLEWVHFGTRYDGHELNGEASTRLTRQLPAGDVAMVYRFAWDGSGRTDVAFLCDRRGNVYGVRVVWTNAIVNQPFMLANATMQFLGGLFMEIYKDDLTAEQRQWVENVVAEANARALLEFALQMQQALRA